MSRLKQTVAKILSNVVGQVRHTMALPVVASKAPEQRRHVTPALRRTTQRLLVAFSIFLVCAIRTHKKFDPIS